MEEDADETGAIKAAIRAAKKTQRPAKIGEKQPSLPSSKQKSKDKARKAKRLRLRWDWGREEWRDVTGWERVRRVRWRRSAVEVRLTKMIVEGACLGVGGEKAGVWRRVWRKASLWGRGTWM